MRMDKAFILAEIKRTAAENGGIALGRDRFEKATGITQNDWYGKFWSKWSDAVREAGSTPDVYQQAYEIDDIAKALALLTRELGRFPVNAELRLKARSDPDFPSHGVFARLGSKQERIRKVIAYCDQRPGFEDVTAICQPLAEGEKDLAETKAEVRVGFAYLARMGKTLQGWSHMVSRAARIRSRNPDAREVDFGALDPHRRSTRDRSLLAQTVRGTPHEWRMVRPHSRGREGVQATKDNVTSDSLRFTCPSTAQRIVVPNGEDCYSSGQSFGRFSISRMLWPSRRRRRSFSTQLRSIGSGMPSMGRRAHGLNVNRARR